MITVVGLGFVGLTTALGFCEKGFKVYGCDIETNKINKLIQGKLPFFEKDLEGVLNKHLNDKFEIVDDLKEAVEKSKVIFFCVGTPAMEDGSSDLSYLNAAITNTLTYIPKKNYKVFVIKSTVPPGTTSQIITPLIEKNGFIIGEDIGIVNNPEFLREGYAWNDFINPDRIVIGQNDDKSGTLINMLYEKFNAPIYRVSLNTAEYIKYLSNTLLATLISFANEQSIIGKLIGDIEIKKAFDILHLDKRWEGNPAAISNYVYPGCGFGGYCLPKDTLALIRKAKENSYSPNILKSVINMNKEIKDYVVKDIINNVDRNEYIGILGLSFKPNSDDVRETPARDIIEALINHGYKNIIAYDPISQAAFLNNNRNLPIEYALDLEYIVDRVSHIVILTAWKEFIDKGELIKKRNVFDYRYIY
ncbi:UDP-glucose dehydrogenase family protein [Cytobacillus firmus]|uniref:UDP-glucose dehydrogenase family protein n=1 Tax=Cytobacillus firmus TaxID=1399 RepID=UPI0024952B66|nr:nucleotide sugar dehydrogenase [Cytobacillus firmus]